MNYDRLIYRIIRLDKNIYLELIQVTENFQRAIAVWVGACIVGILAVVDLVRALVNYVKDELPAITQILAMTYQIRPNFRWVSMESSGLGLFKTCCPLSF